MEVTTENKVYEVGKTYRSICKWKACGMQFEWVYDGKKPRECCKQRCGLLVIVSHTLYEIARLSGRKVELTPDQAADCIQYALLGYSTAEVADLTGYPASEVEFFLNSKSAEIRHKLRSTTLYRDIPEETKTMIRANFKRGENKHSLATRFRVPRSAVDKILEEEPVKVKTDEIPVIEVKSTVISKNNMNLFTKVDGSQFYVKYEGTGD